MYSALPIDDKTIHVGIVGCGGFIGSHLVRYILANTGWKIIGIDTSNEKIKTCLGDDRFKFIKSDYLKSKHIKEITEKCSPVIFLASLCNPSLYNTIPIDVMESNFTSPVRIADACAEQGKWLIHFSSSEVYGKTSDSTLSEDTSPLILGPVSSQRWSYASAKQLMERYIYAAGQTRNLPYTILRPFNFIGPRMDYIPGVDGEGVPRVFACFMESLLNRKPLQLVDGGDNRRCFTYIDDVMECMMNIFQNPSNAIGQIFNVGNAHNEIRIRTLAKEMADIYRMESEYASEWKPVFRDVMSEDFYGPGYEDSKRRMPDISKAEKLLSWKAGTDLNEALTLTIQWFIEHYRD